MQGIAMINIDSLWFKLYEGESIFQTAKQGGSYRSASLLKPLYAWAACNSPPYSENLNDWHSLAKRSIVMSDNNTTSELWETVGAAEMLDKLHEKTGIIWNYENGYNTWGSIKVSARDVAVAYVALINSNDECSNQIFSWMKDVSDQQSFGVKTALVKSLGINPKQIALKAGWFIDETECRLRTHIVAICHLKKDYYIGCVILTSKDVDSMLTKRYLSQYESGEEVLNIHNQYMSNFIKNEAVKLCEVAKLVH